MSWPKEPLRIARQHPGRRLGQPRPASAAAPTHWPIHGPAQAECSVVQRGRRGVDPCGHPTLAPGGAPARAPGARQQQQRRDACSLRRQAANSIK